MIEHCVLESSKGVLILVHVVPGAKKTELQGFFGEPARLKLKVSAPPVEGAANEAILKFISKALGGARVELLRGGKSRKKDILVSGLDVVSVRKNILVLMGVK